MSQQPVSTALHPAFQSTPINSSLQNFDHLPDSAMVRLPIVAALYGCSKATIWRLVKNKRLNTYKLSERCTTFNVGELKKFLASKASV